MNNKVEKINPSGVFTNYIYKAIPLAFDESMSYYETLCNVLDQLKTQNEVINNNADVIQELEDFVSNYFDNLDVQEEINNKLDEMVEDGTMDELLNTNLTGSLSDLETTDKSNLVSAINEVNTKAGNNTTNIGDLSNLDTTEKSNLVGGINELVSNDNLINQNIEQNASYLTTETEIGTWINGKPLYRKVIDTGDLTDSTRYDENNLLVVDTNISVAITPRKINCIGGDDDYWFDFSSRQLLPNNDLIWLDVVLVTNKLATPITNKINISAEGGQLPLYEKESYVILEYTKDED